MHIHFIPNDTIIMLNKGEMYMVCLYKEKSYKIFETNDGYKIYNQANGRVAFMRDYKTCTWLIHLLNEKKIPYGMKSRYLLSTLCILTDDMNYRYNIEFLLEKNKKKKKRGKRK